MNRNAPISEAFDFILFLPRCSFDWERSAATYRGLQGPTRAAQGVISHSKVLRAPMPPAQTFRNLDLHAPLANKTFSSAALICHVPLVPICQNCNCSSCSEVLQGASCSQHGASLLQLFVCELVPLINRLTSVKATPHFTYQYFPAHSGSIFRRFLDYFLASCRFFSFSPTVFYSLVQFRCSSLLVAASSSS